LFCCVTSLLFDPRQWAVHAYNVAFRARSIRGREGSENSSRGINQKESLHPASLSLTLRDYCLQLLFGESSSLSEGVLREQRNGNNHS
jgi:hypothetical protein